MAVPSGIRADGIVLWALQKINFHRAFQAAAIFRRNLSIKF